MSEVVLGTVTASLAVLWNAGLRFGSAIDVGAADGQFSVSLYEVGVFDGCRMLNLDANEIYRESLEAIRAAIGADYRICAVAERSGTIDMVRTAHPYWNAALPPDHAYWQTAGGAAKERTARASRTLDDLAAELALPGPFFIKLDIQGGELAALAGATRILADTAVIAVETTLADFDAIHRFVSDRGFVLFDLTQINRMGDGSAGWFYPVYLDRARAALRPAVQWFEVDAPQEVAHQDGHRAHVQRWIADALARRRSAGRAR